MPLTLYAIPGHYRTAKILIAAEYNGVAVDTPAFDYTQDSQKDWFKAKNPSGKVPLLDTDNGTVFESNAIARYFARVRADTELYGASFYEASQVDQWIDYSANELELPACVWTYPLLNMMQFNEAATAKAKQDVFNVLKVLDDHLLLKTFLVGNHVTLADIVVATALLPLFQMVLAPDSRAKYVNATRWFMTCVNQPEFAKILGEVTLAAKEQTTPGAPSAVAAPVAAKAAAPAKEQGGGKKEKKEKQPKQKKEAPPAKEKAPEVLPEDMPASAEPEGFYQDGWKKEFSNKPASEYMPWFWDRMAKSASEFSIWHCKAQDADKYLCQADWMTTNQVNGYLQRAEPCRKVAFGVLGMHGTSSQQEIEGVWVWKGMEYLPQMGECADAEYYDFRKLDWQNNADDKALVEKYFDYKGTLAKGGDFGNSAYGFGPLKPVSGDSDTIMVYK